MALVVKGVEKRFGALVAVQPIDIEFQPGQVHAVVGENGAGKSTLVSILAGFLSPTQGTVTLDGAEIPYGQPFRCKRLGIEMIHQHFTLVSAFTAEENLALARLDGLARTIRAADVAAKAFEIAARLGWLIPRGVPVGRLPVGDQQRIEILKALSGDARVILFDEPTAVLTPEEVEDLLRVIRQLRDEGKIIILIAHKLNEVFAVADVATVLRRGVHIGTTRIDATTPTQLAEWMVGELPESPDRVSKPVGPARLTVKNLVAKGDRGENALRGLDFELRAGEILGVGGVDGNGQIELAEVVAGVRPPVDPAALSWVNSRSRVGYIPQDRQTDGLAMSMTILDNMWIEGAHRPELTRGPILRLKDGFAWSKGLIERFSIKADGPNVPIASLSGGNQQKVVAARVLDRRPDVLVAVNPTRGLDLKAVEFVHEQIRSARDEGAAVLLISTDLDELAALSDRQVFLSRGAFVEGLSAESLVGGSAK